MIKSVIKFCFLYAFMTYALTSHAQNLAPNPSFELFSSCPVTPNFGNMLLQCDPWQCASEGTADYFNACANPGQVGVPSNFLGYQDPLTGVGYAGLFTKTGNNQYREYIQAELLTPLIAGRIYYVSFNVSMTFGSCAVQWIGAYFSDGPPAWSSDQVLDYEPQIESTGAYLTDSIGWMLIEGCFTATGDETHITIGNFRNNAETPSDPNCPFFWPTAYYYIDDIFVEEIEPGGVPLELGDPIDVCGEYEIDPNISNVNYLWEDGSTASTLVVTSSGTYALTVTDGCESGIDSIEVNFINQPPVNIPESDINLCIGESFDISLDPDAGSYQWQDGSTSPFYTITEAGIYQVTLDDGCDITTDEVFVFMIEPPSFSLGPDFILCPDAEADLYLDPALGEFLWQNNSTSNSFIVSEPGLYSVAVTNECGTTSDEIEALEGIAETFSLGPDTTLCFGEELILSVNSPGANLLWHDGSTADSFLVTSSGSYFVQASNACFTFSDTIVFGSNSNAPLLDLPAQLLLCQSSQILLDPGISNVMFLWNDGSQNSTLNVSATGTYSLTISNGCGTAADSVIVIDGGPAPAVSLGLDLDLCPGDTYVLTPVFSDVDMWLWSDGSAGSDYTISNAGIVSIEVSNSCGNAFDTLLVGLLPDTPPLDLGQDTSLCSGQSFTLSINTPGVTILWPDGSTGTDYTISSAGSVDAAISNSCGSSFDTIQVNALPDIPILNLGIDQFLCPGEILTVSPGIADVQYLWQDGTTGTSYQSSQEELVILTISNDCGTSTDTLEVTENMQGPQLDLGSDIQVCSGQTVNIQSGISGVNHLWQDGSTNPDFTTAQSGIFILEVSNNCGSATDTIVVDISGTPPTPVLPADTVLCEDNSLLLTSTADAETSIEWQDGSAGSTFTVTSAGVYTLTESNRCGDASDTIVVDISGAPPTPVLPADTSLCEGNSILLTSNAEVETTIEWQDGSTGSTFTVTSAGVYSLTESNRCGAAADTITVVYLDAPNAFTLGPDTTLCPGETIPLVAPSTAYSILWQDGSDVSSIITNQAGTYSLQLSNECGSESDELIVSIETNSPQLNLDPSISWCEGDIITLDANQSFAATYLWSTGEDSPSIEISTPGIYSIEVSNLCKAVSQEVEIFIGTDCEVVEVDNEIYIPNVFSPNDDGINDLFVLSFGSDLQVIALTGSIFDRWGNLVYSSEAIPFQWDGLFGDEEVLPGVYVYHIKCMYLEGSEEIEKAFSGDVTVVR